jgi:hypothetical protein
LKEEHTNLKEEHTNLKEEHTNLKEEHTNLKEEHTNLNNAYNSLALMNNDLNYEYNKIKQELVSNINDEEQKLVIHNINTINNAKEEEITLLKAEIDMYKTKESLSLNKILELKNMIHKLNEEAITNINYNNEKVEGITNNINNQKEQEINLLKADIDMYKTKENLSLNELLAIKNVNHKLNEENLNLKEAITNLNQNITILNKSNEDILLKKRIKELEENNKSLENVNKLILTKYFNKEWLRNYILQFVV